MKKLLFSCVLVFLYGCGSSGNDSEISLAQTSEIAVHDHLDGWVPFVSYVELTGVKSDKIREVTYTIATKSGNHSKPVRVSYSSGWLIRKGYLIPSATTMTVPIIGLYSNFTNSVVMDIVFIDASEQELTTTIPTGTYVDPLGVYDVPTIIKNRETGVELGFNYFGTKPFYGLPVIIDTDGEIRWAAGSVLNSFNSFAYVWDQNAFVVGADTSVEFKRYELDGSVSSEHVLSSAYNSFHHKIGNGKFGLLGEFATDVVQNGDAIAEFSPSGKVIKQWDIGAIISALMMSYGEDPALFVRPGIDWFHSNAVIYDPKDNSVVVSSRENFVIKLDYESGEIKWIFGDPSKYWYGFASLRSKSLSLNPGGLFPVGQHGLSINANGDLMLFNNGLGSLRQPAGESPGLSRTFSTVSVYSINASALSATETWQFDNGQGVLSDICSSASEGPNKSILVTYSAAAGRTKAKLVGLNSANQVVFDFEYPSLGCQHFFSSTIIPLERLRFN